jgi:predicted anti-sigma-YlaC factor YlaD
MKCTEYKKLVSMLLDGELSEQGERELSAHCAACDECQRYKEEMSFLFSGVAAPSAITPSPWFFSKVQRRIEAEQERDAAFSFKGFRWVNTLTLSATVVLTLLAGNFFGSTLWSGIRPATSFEAAETVAGVSAINDLPEEFDGIYYTERG